MTRLELTDSMEDVLVKMAEGNPGAVTTCLQLMTNTYDEVEGTMFVLYLDTLGIYSSRIWMLYKDCCGEYINRVADVLRAWQLGFMEEGEIHEHINNSIPIKMPATREMLAGIEMARAYGNH